MTKELDSKTIAVFGSAERGTFQMLMAVTKVTDCFSFSVYTGGGLLPIEDTRDLARWILDKTDGIVTAEQAAYDQKVLSGLDPEGGNGY